MLGDVEVLCFDEFHCNDPGDAMLLARMFKFIMDRGILLITTSNYPPEELLADEYYHHLILPTIATIREHMNVHELDAQQDYRASDIAPSMRRGYNTGSLLVDPRIEELQQHGLTSPAAQESVRLKPTSHEITAREPPQGRFGSTSSGLCESLTSTLDYLELAKDYEHWVISGVPGPAAMTPFGLRRLANAIDVLYDHDIRVDLLIQRDFTESFRHLPALDAARLESRLNALQKSACENNHRRCKRMSHEPVPSTKAARLVLLPRVDPGRTIRLVELHESGSMPPIVQLGHPVLRMRGQAFTGQLEPGLLRRFLDTMRAVMLDAPGVGLAAPQLGIPLRIAVLQDLYDTNPEIASAREREPLEYLEIINPEYRPVGARIAGFYEGCLSFNGYQGVVERPADIATTYIDAAGVARMRDFSGWQARIFQHETDHLDGTVYIDKALTRSLCANHEYPRWTNPGIDEARTGLGF